jgi:hypothetical protein
MLQHATISATFPYFFQMIIHYNPIDIQHRHQIKCRHIIRLPRQWRRLFGIKQDGQRSKRCEKEMDYATLHVKADAFSETWVPSPKIYGVTIRRTVSYLLRKLSRLSKEDEKLAHILTFAGIVWKMSVKISQIRNRTSYHKNRNVYFWNFVDRVSLCITIT